MSTEITNQTRPFVALSAEGAVQAMLVQLDETAAESDALEHGATRERFDAAEDAIDEAATKSRRSMWAGVLDGAAGIAEGVAGSVAAASAASGSGDAGAAGGESVTPDSGTDSSSMSTLRRVTASSADDVLKIGSTILAGSAARADEASSRAELLSERAKDRGEEASERATRDRGVRETLTRQLDELMRERHSADERAMAALGR